MLRNVYPGAEFMTSNDQLFRPVNISNAPDGTLYVADMYHGIIQELQWSGPGTYLRAKIEQYQLDKVAAHGRIWRLRYDGRAAVPGQRRRTSASRRFRQSNRISPHRGCMAKHPRSSSRT